jgi:glucokinase
MSKKNELKLDLVRHILRAGKTTRPELVAATGCRAATVFEVIDQLKESGVIIEPDRVGIKTGRRAPLLHCNPDYCRCVGIDFQLKRTLACVTDTSGNILHRCEIPSDGRRTLEDSRREISEAMRFLRIASGSQWQHVRGVGFADPGMVDVDKGISIRAISVPGWENLDTANWFRHYFNLDCGVWPEEMVKTHMEYTTRGDNPPKSLFHLGMDGGIGGGFISNGNLFVGSSYQGMEIGHVVIEPDGPVCQCGNRGCLEALAGYAGILHRIRDARAEGVDTDIDIDNFSVKQFVQCAKHDKAARIIANEVCDSIGTALAVVVALLNPELIVLSGELTNLGQPLLDAIWRQLGFNCFNEAVKDLKIEISSLDLFDTARGAAIMMRDRIMLESPEASYLQ